MELRQLKYFLVLCEELNYTRAARRLYLTRQALRQSIETLEQEMGEPLLTNSRNHLALTERGRWLWHHAAPVVQSFEQLKRDACASANPTHPLRLGVSVALVPDYLPELPHRLEEFKNLHANVGLEVSFQLNDAVIAGTEDGTLDLGLIMDLENAVYGVPKTVCRRNQLSLLAAQGHPLWGRERAEVTDLRGECLSLPGKRPEPFAALKKACCTAGFALDFREVPSFYEVSYLVRHEGLIGITCDENAAQSRFDPVWVLPLAGLPPLCVSLLRGTAAQGILYELLWKEEFAGLNENSAPAMPE